MRHLFTLLLVLLPLTVVAQDTLVANIRAELVVAKARLREANRDVQSLSRELERVRARQQQNKEGARRAKKQGRDFTPKPVARTYYSVYRHAVADTTRKVMAVPARPVMTQAFAQEAHRAAEAARRDTAAAQPQPVETPADPQPVEPQIIDVTDAPPAE